MSRKSYHDLERRGQVEIIGLMIVVILIVIGMMFYLKYGILQDKRESVRDNTLDQSYAINWLNAILNVKVCNEEMQFSDALVECGENGEICGKDACQYLKDEVGNIITSLNLKDYRNYTMSIKNNDNIIYLQNECKSKGTKFGADQVHKSDTGDEYIIHFEIC